MTNDDCVRSHNNVIHHDDDNDCVTPGSLVLASDITLTLPCSMDVNLSPSPGVPGTTLSGSIFVRGLCTIDLIGRDQYGTVTCRGEDQPYI